MGLIDIPPGVGTADEIPFQNTAPRAALVNIESGEQLTFQFNPETFTEAFGVNYAKHTVPGLGFQILQYINTNNNSIPLSLYLSDMSERFDEWSPDNTKRFLQSLCYPVRGASGDWIAPPLVLFVWPKVVRFKCVVTDLKFTHQKFSGKTLAPLVTIADLTLEEVVATQRFSDDVRKRGSQQQG